jgi:hypothetical protein
MFGENNRDPEKCEQTYGSYPPKLESARFHCLLVGGAVRYHGRNDQSTDIGVFVDSLPWNEGVQLELFEEFGQRHQSRPLLFIMVRGLPLWRLGVPLSYDGLLYRPLNIASDQIRRLVIYSSRGLEKISFY